MKEKKQKKSKQEKGNKKEVKGLKLLSQTEFETIARIREARTNLHVSNSDSDNWKLTFFSPNENNINTANRLTFNIGPYRDHELKFHETHPLIMDCKYEITVHEIDAGGVEKSETNDQKLSLKPETHGAWPPPCTGSLSYFSKFRASYNGSVTNDTEVLHAANLDELNTIASMDVNLCSDEALLESLENVGLIPLKNNYGKTVTNLINRLGKIPNQNYPDASAPSSTNNNAGFYRIYGRIPTPPFRKFSPQMWKKMSLNSGGDTRVGDNTITFPPKTYFKFDFLKTPEENYIHEFYFPNYTDAIASTIGDNPTHRRFEVNGKKYIIKKIHWIVDKVQLCGYLKPYMDLPKINFPLFNTYITCRRIQETLLGPDRFPIISYFVDQKNLGLNFILCFRRGLDLDRNPNSTEHSFSAQTCFRPATLNKIEIFEGGDEGGDFIIFNQNSIKNLAHEKLDPSMAAYAEKLFRDGWISKKDVRNFWELPYTEKNDLGTIGSGNVGTQNFFPVNLTDMNARKRFNFYTANGLRGENINIKLEFTEPLDKRWYLLIISEYLVHLKFDSTTGAPSFEICS